MGAVCRVEIEGVDLGRRVFDAVEALWACRDLEFREQTRYVFRFGLVPSSAQVRFFVGDREEHSLSSLGASEQVYVVAWGNYVGRTTLAIEVDGARSEGRFEVRARKLGCDADFQRMVDDISRTVTNLAFDLRSRTGFGFTRRAGSGARGVYEDLVFLETIVDEVETVCRRIGRAPHKRTVREYAFEAFSSATHVDERSLSAMTGPGAGLSRSDKRTALARRLRGRLPQRVYAGRVRTVYDTYENRFLKFVLHALRVRAAEIGSACVRRLDASFSDRADRLKRRLDALARMDFLEEVGELRSLEAPSPVLLKEDNYRAVLRKYQEFLLLTMVDWEELDRTIGARDVARLYEYWTYFELLRTLGVDPSALFVRSRDGFRIRIDRSPVSAGRCTVYYNRTFSASRRDSYSLALRPDITVEREGRRLLFDAKYRFEEKTLAAERTEGELDREEWEERDRRFIAGDLYKMHAYRDAIADACGVFILFPGSRPPQVFPKADELGVGAIPLRPGADNKRSLELIARMVEEL